MVPLLMPAVIHWSGRGHQKVLIQALSPQVGQHYLRFRVPSLLRSRHPKPTPLLAIMPASNQSDNTSAEQDVSVLAESDTDLLSVTGSGGGALVGVGITGDSVVLNKETKAYIDDNARVSSGVISYRRC